MTIYWQRRTHALALVLVYRFQKHVIYTDTLKYLNNNYNLVNCVYMDIYINRAKYACTYAYFKNSYTRIMRFPATLR